jgi:excisionase family DNA binding protein
MIPDLFTPKEAAAILKVRQSWLERQAAGRRIPFTMLGGSYRFTADHLAQIVQIFETNPEGNPDTVTALNQSSSHPRKRTTAETSTESNTRPLRPRPRIRVFNSHESAA